MSTGGTATRLRRSQSGALRCSRVAPLVLSSPLQSSLLLSSPFLCRSLRSSALYVSPPVLWSQSSLLLFSALKSSLFLSFPFLSSPLFFRSLSEIQIAKLRRISHLKLTLGLDCCDVIIQSQRLIFAPFFTQLRDTCSPFSTTNHFLSGSWQLKDKI